jgi:hypothetical protein
MPTTTLAVWSLYQLIGEKKKMTPENAAMTGYYNAIVLDRDVAVDGWFFSVAATGFESILEKYRRN